MHITQVDSRENIRCSILWPLFSRELRRKAHGLGANSRGGGEDAHTEGGETVANRTLTDVNGRHFGISSRFSVVDRR